MLAPCRWHRLPSYPVLGRRRRQPGWQVFLFLPFGMERFPPCSQSCPGWDCDDLGRVRSRAGCRAATAVTFGDGCGAAGRCAGPGSGSAPHHRPATARPPLPLAFGEIWSRPGWCQPSHSLQSPRPVPPTRHAHQTQMLPSNSISFLADRKSA